MTKNMKTTFIIMLGLFTTAPMYAQFSRLHIKSPAGANYGVTTESSSNGKIVTLSHDGTAGIISTGSLSGSVSSPLNFSTGGSVRMTISETGQIGIGTSTITAELTVAGKIHAREVKVNVGAGTGPDYVFASEYPLPTLKELERYINANNHLPEVPAAKVMETEGVNVSEMNMLLLKKVEEMTLYVIAQEKKIDSLKEELEIQKKLLSVLSEKIK
jgi:hypothetical protein